MWDGLGPDKMRDNSKAPRLSEYLPVRKYRCGSGKICRNLPSDPKAEKNRGERRKCISELAGNGAESLG